MSSSPVARQTRGLVLVNLNLVDVVGKRVLPDHVVVIEDDAIARVGPRSDFGSCISSVGCERLDLGGNYLVPGISDVHVHLLSSFAEDFGGKDALEAQPPAIQAHLASLQARRALDSGITLLRAVGESSYQDVALKHAVTRGWTIGPQVVTSGHIIIRTAGHGSGSSTCTEVDGPWEMLRAVREEARNDVDFVKLMGTGGVASFRDPHNVPQFLDEELVMAVKAAGGLGKPVAVHAGESRFIERCAQLGVRSIEHGYELDERAASAMAENGTYLVPTLVVTSDEEYIAERPPWIQERARAVRDAHVQSYRTALAAGVKIAVGTDVPDFWRYTHREMRLLAEMGMSNWDVMAAAVVTSAELCGLPRGGVEVGSPANLIAVSVDPSQSLDFEHPSLVIARGVVVRNGSGI